MDDDLKRSLEEVRRYFDVVAERMESKVDGVVEALESRIDDVRHYFDIVAERTESKIEAIAEGIDSRIDEVQRQISALRESSARGFDDTQAMIRFSHAELDRRMRALEGIVADLQSRIERLESTSTH